jgi:hypothetical protein
VARQEGTVISRFLIQATWNDCGHLTEEAKLELFQSLPPYQRDARSKGIPVLGSGAIFPIPESDVVLDDFPIPDHWPRCYGFDVGWSRSAAAFLCLSRDTDTLYVYAEHYRGEAEPVVHAEAIKARGQWIKGAIDPAARGRGQIDGRQLVQMYRDLGLDLTEAENAVESGLYELMTRMSSGRFKVFRSCQNWLSEFRMYRRDEKGRVVKTFDHLMDATRYAHSRLHDIIGTQPKKKKEETQYVTYGGRSATGWMG